MKAKRTNPQRLRSPTDSAAAAAAESSGTRSSFADASPSSSSVPSPRSGNASSWMAADAGDSHDMSPSRSILKVENSAHINRARLGNMLKLPKVLRWMCCEWFLSNLDEASFRFENEFERLLSEHFPLLGTRNLRRLEWVRIRRMLGKPRRCSRAFLEEERRQLSDKRRRIRAIQQRKNAEFVPDDLTHLPDRLPLPLTIGTRVICIDFGPNGVTLVSGGLQGIDSMHSQLRVLLDKPVLNPSPSGPEGSLILKSFMDCDVSSFGTHNTIPTSGLLQKTRVRSWLFPSSPAAGSSGAGGSSGGASGQSSNYIATMAAYQQHRYSATPNYARGDSTHDGANSAPPHSGATPGGNQGSGGCGSVWESGSSNMPARLLATIARLARVLSVKKELIARVRELSMRAERLKSYDQAYPEELKQSLAGLALSLEQLNRDLSGHLVEIQRLVGCGCSQNNSGGSGSFLVAAFGDPIANHAAHSGGSTVVCSGSSGNQQSCVMPGVCDVAKDVSDTGGMDMVQRLNSKSGRVQVQDRRSLDLITKLTSLMVQIQLLGDDDSGTGTTSMSGSGTTAAGGLASALAGSAASSGNSNSNAAVLQGLGSSHQLAALQKSIQNIKDSLDPANQRCFFENVEVHLNVIKSGILQAGNLYMFTQQPNGTAG